MLGIIAEVQNQIHDLQTGMNSLRAHLGPAAALQQPSLQQTPIDPSLQSMAYTSHRPSFAGPQASPGAPVASMSPTIPRPKSQSQSSHTTFRGPTSADFNFGVAKSSLSQMGITSSQTEGHREGSGAAGTGTREQSPAGTPPSQQWVKSWNPEKDPLWTVPQEESIRLCNVYEDEMGLMYPVLNIGQVIEYAKRLYKFMEAAHRSGLMQQGMPGPDNMDDEDSSILKLVMATALTVEAGGRSELGKKMFERVQPAVETCMLGNGSFKAVQILAMAVSPPVLANIKVLAN